MMSRRAMLQIGVAAGAAALSACSHLDRRPFAVLEGERRQGALLRGRTRPGAAVALDGTPVRVSRTGRFAIGFGRDQGVRAMLTASAPGVPPMGETIAVARRLYAEQRIDSLAPEMVTPPGGTLERIRADQALVTAARAHDTEAEWFAGALHWPVTGPITGVYGSARILNGQPRQPHYGIDIAAPEGTAIVAPLTGIVRLAEPDLYFTGGTVILDHGHGVSTTYLHMSRLDVSAGDRVRQGERIGAVGMTGRATGPHLCWRLNWFQVRLDPQSVAPPMPA